MKSLRLLGCGALNASRIKRFPLNVDVEFVFIHPLHRATYSPPTWADSLLSMDIYSVTDSFIYLFFNKSLAVLKATVTIKRIENK